jgi:hypothetical protein
VAVKRYDIARFEESRDHYLGLLHQELQNGSYEPRFFCGWRSTNQDRPSSVHSDVKR